MRYSIHNLLPLAAACVLLSGCGGGPEGMAPVSGSITWNGQPLPSGYVYFDPTDGRTPQASQVTNGHYSLHAYTGVNTVRVEATAQTSFNPSMNQHAYKQYLPPEFNRGSTLSEDVLPGQPNTFDFQLEGKPE